MKLSDRLKDWLITIGIYSSILIPMFIMIRDPEPTQTGRQDEYQASALVAQFVVMRNKHRERVQRLGITTVDYKDRYIGFYVEEYPQLLVGDKVAVKVGTLKVFFERNDIVGVAPVAEKNRTPQFSEVAPIK